MSTLSTADLNSRIFASASDIRAAFNKRHQELRWLAYFITADEAAAAECVTDACTLTENHNSVFEQWLATWARYATIRAALNYRRDEIKEVGARYERTDCDHGGHLRLSSENVDRVVEYSEALISNVDVLGRAALLICGVEGHSLSEAGLLIGQSKAIVLAAYCTALTALIDTNFAVDYGHPNHF